MEFRLPCIDAQKTVYIRLISHPSIEYIGDGKHMISESMKRMNVCFEFQIGDKLYNSVYDDIIYIDGEKKSSLIFEEFEKYCQINTRIRYDERFWILSAVCSVNYVWLMNFIAIKKPSVENIVEVIKIQPVEKIVEKEKIVEVVKIETVEKIVEKEKNVEVIKYLDSGEIEECPICNENKAIITFSCCSIKYCCLCAMKLKSCAQCRSDIVKLRQMV